MGQLVIPETQFLGMFNLPPSTVITGISRAIGRVGEDPTSAQVALIIIETQ